MRHAVGDPFTIQDSQYAFQINSLANPLRISIRDTA